MWILRRSFRWVLPLNLPNLIWRLEACTYQICSQRFLGNQSVNFGWRCFSRSIYFLLLLYASVNRLQLSFGLWFPASDWIGFSLDVHFTQGDWMLSKIFSCNYGNTFWFWLYSLLVREQFKLPNDFSERHFYFSLRTGLAVHFSLILRSTKISRGSEVNIALLEVDTSARRSLFCRNL